MFCLNTRARMKACCFFLFCVCFLMSPSFIRNHLFQMSLFHMERQEKVVRKLQDAHEK